MIVDRTDSRTRPTSWLLAAAATCVFVFGLLPSAVMAACAPEANHSCCCSSADESAESSHGCEASSCDCHVRPDDNVPDVDTSVMPSVDSVELPDAPLEATLRSEQRPRSVLRVSAPRGDPLPPPAQPIYIRNRVLLL